MSYAQELRQHAAAAHMQAQSATLPNVRFRYLQSAATWTQLADKAERFEQMQPCAFN